MLTDENPQSVPFSSTPIDYTMYQYFIEYKMKY